MRGCPEHYVGGDGFNLEQGEFEASLGHQLSGDIKFGYMRLKERTRTKRGAWELRGKAAEYGPKAKEESVLSRSAQPLQKENQNSTYGI